jgi:polyphosphate kinase 2
MTTSGPPRMKRRAFERELEHLQRELVLLQEYIKAKGLKVVVIFEGRDAAGKGGVIKRITERTSPRAWRIAALGTPTERERTQWYFQRYVAHLPAAGEMVLFDRSWYNRAGVERVMGFCTDEEYREFMRSCPEFERMLVRSGIILIKYWFSVSDAEQERRSKRASPIRCGVGSSARWTCCHARSGSSTHARKTTCSPIPTSSRRRGTSSRVTTSGERA